MTAPVEDPVVAAQRFIADHLVDSCDVAGCGCDEPHIEDPEVAGLDRAARIMSALLAEISEMRAAITDAFYNDANGVWEYVDRPRCTVEGCWVEGGHLGPHLVIGVDPAAPGGDSSAFVSGASVAPGALEPPVD